ncbi:MAG: alkaline phosphatase [Planctomycetota bacterium]|nr:alkaline phosphatase [Planctomycetota bacterium]
MAVAAFGAAASAEPTLLPIDRAKFLAGQRFDFLVEVKDASASGIIAAVNGKPAEEFFGKKGELKTVAGVTSYRINQVAFPVAGDVAVKASAVVGGKEYSASAGYVVAMDKSAARARNVILFIGDGLSLPVRDMARILSKGMRQGKYNDLLEMEKLTNTALVTTSGYDSLVTDSANAASAYATGHKSVVNAMGVYESSDKDPLTHPKVENIVEIVKRTRGMAAGLVTTSNITDATPAAMIAHTRRRAEQNFIAQSMLDPERSPDVILGGGSRHFLPKSVPGSKRVDERNLVEEFKAKGYAFAGDRAEMKKAGGDKILGLFQLDNLNVYLDREMLKDAKTLGGFEDQPNLMEMTEKAIDILSRNRNGFFLMVEGACIDKQLHTMDWQRAVYDTIEFDKAIGIGRKFAAGRDDTLIIVVADHSHGASITGTYHEKDGKTGREAVRTYAASVFPTFVDEDGDGFPDNPDAEVTLAVQFANHPDYKADYRLKSVPESPAVMDGKRAIANPNSKGEAYPGNIPYNESSEVHSADSVVLNAGGPGEDFFRGVLDNTDVFHGMVRALGIDNAAN